MKVMADGKNIPGVQSVYEDHLYLGDTARSALHLKVSEALTVEAWNALLSGFITKEEDGAEVDYEGYNAVHECAVTLLRQDDAERTVTELNRKLAAAESAKEESQESLEVAQGVQAVLVRVLAPKVNDAEALTILSVWTDWKPDTTYAENEVVRHGGTLYRVIQAHTSQAHQQPGGEGMLAVYRPIVVDAAGTQADPIPFVQGMDVEEGKYYGYGGSLYLAKAAMPACVWPPDTAGLWQWEKVG